MTAADKQLDLTKPPKYIEAPDAFFEPEARVVMMDDQGIDRAMMWPTLASLLEERLTDDPVATHVVVHALNQWMHEQWTFNFENRIFPTPVITLPIVDQAIEELEWVVERGAKAILVRPAPVPDFNGRRRSFALPSSTPSGRRSSRRTSWWGCTPPTAGSSATSTSGRATTASSCRSTRSCPASTTSSTPTTA